MRSIGDSLNGVGNRGPIVGSREGSIGDGAAGIAVEVEVEAAGGAGVGEPPFSLSEARTISTVFMSVAEGDVNRLTIAALF